MTDHDTQTWTVVCNKKPRTKTRGNSDNLHMIQKWQPSSTFNATPAEIHTVREIGITENWNKTAFHGYFKTIETNLLIQFRNYANEHFEAQTHMPDYINDEWFVENAGKWKLLALLRDFHDHMCNRDKKHYIRTDDCRRFIPCIIRGIDSGVFAMPVHRLLNGDTAPRKFTHPWFLQFAR